MTESLGLEVQREAAFFERESSSDRAGVYHDLVPKENSCTIFYMLPCLCNCFFRDFWKIRQKRILPTCTFNREEVGQID